MLMEFILKQKSHLIYGLIIIFIGSIAYHFFNKTPERVVHTVTKFITQEKVVTKDRIVYVDKTIVTHKKNGDIIVEKDKEHSNTNTHAITDTKTKIKDTTITSYQKNYSLDVLAKLDPSHLNSTPNPLDTQVNFGVRLFDLPVFAVVGITGRVDSLYVGLRYEW